MPDFTQEEAEQLRKIIPQKVSTVSDKLSRSFGPAVWVDEEHFMIDNLLFVGDESPAEATETYGTVVDNQVAIDLKIYENVGKDRINDKHVMPSIDENGNEQYTDPALKVKNWVRLNWNFQQEHLKALLLKCFFGAVQLALR